MPMVPLTWLKDHVDVPQGTTAQQLSADLVRVGLEEETIHPARVQGPLVVGRVLTREETMQSNGKSINYCRVDVGQFNDEPGTGKEPSDLPSRGIICGAHNFDVDDLVVVSLPGAVLPGPFPIAARKTYGHTSDGMICSERELGMGTDHSGILVLTRKFPDRQIPAPGSDLISFLGLGEEVLEINVTPDRGYCFAMRGIAREYALSTGQRLRDPGLEGVLVEHVPPATPDGFPVELADDAPIRGKLGCDRFVARMVRGVDPNAKSPQWMVDRLEMAGMRSISLPVDVTNYVMLDLGQPMHAYDAGKLAGPIVVRRARAGEHLVTLDDQDRELHTQDLLITDSPHGQAGSRIIGLAGVMGGQYGEISSDTTDIVLEAAHFDAVSIARTARRHRLPSAASKLFERGTDPAICALAAQRAVDLLVEYGNAQALPAVTDNNLVEPREVITMKDREPARLIGRNYPTEQVREILEAIGCHVEHRDDVWSVTPPTWRPDLTGYADLVEEIARLDGYDNIPSTLPATPTGAGLTVSQQARREACDTLAHAGLTEVKSYPFVGDAWDRQGIAADDVRRHALRLRNPLAEDAPWLRTSILDTLLPVAERNVSRGAASVALFETGTIATPAGVKPAELVSANQRPSDEMLRRLRAGVPTQPWHIGAVLAGGAVPTGVLENERAWDWADAIEMVRSVCASLGVHVEVTRAWVAEALESAGKRRGGPKMPDPTVDPVAVAPFHPGRVARLFVRQGREMIDVAFAGELHPGVCQRFGLPKRSAAFELNLDALINAMDPEPIQVAAVSSYPLAKEDVAFVVEDSIPAGRVEQVIRQACQGLAEDVTLFDIYRGDQLPAGHRSLAFGLRLRAADHTLSAEETAEVRHRVISKVSKVLGAQLRS